MITGGHLAGSVPDGPTDANTAIAYEPIWLVFLPAAEGSFAGTPFRLAVLRRLVKPLEHPPYSRVGDVDGRG